MEFYSQPVDVSNKQFMVEWFKFIYILVGAVQKQSKQINLSAGKYWGSSLLMMLGLKRM